MDRFSLHHDEDKIEKMEEGASIRSQSSAAMKSEHVFLSDTTLCVLFFGAAQKVRAPLCAGARA